MTKDSKDACTDCNGTIYGFHTPYGDGKCSECKGKGYLTDYVGGMMKGIAAGLLGDPADSDYECPECSGTCQCQKCRGTGWIYYNSDDNEEEDSCDKTIEKGKGEDEFESSNNSENDSDDYNSDSNSDDYDSGGYSSDDHYSNDTNSYVAISQTQIDKENIFQDKRKDKSFRSDAFSVLIFLIFMGISIFIAKIYTTESSNNNFRAPGTSATIPQSIPPTKLKPQENPTNHNIESAKSKIVESDDLFNSNSSYYVDYILDQKAGNPNFKIFQNNGKYIIEYKGSEIGYFETWQKIIVINRDKPLYKTLAYAYSEYNNTPVWNNSNKEIILFYVQSNEAFTIPQPILGFVDLGGHKRKVNEKYPSLWCGYIDPDSLHYVLFEPNGGWRKN